jgi:hypothetical protein
MWRPSMVAPWRTKGPYASFDEANDALLALQRADFDESEAEGRI